MLGYTASPTGQRFLDSRKFGKLICGPVGGGKSTVALMDLLRRSVLQTPFEGVRHTKHLILRNTIAQLKSTVKPMMTTWFETLVQRRMGHWQLTDQIFIARFRLPDNTVVLSEFMLMAADTPDDVRRLLSLEVSSAWIEEGREVEEDIVSGLTGRVNRFPARLAGGVTYPGVIVSTNAPPIGGYWHNLMTNPPQNWEIFMQPPALLEDGHLNPIAENLENLAPDYYDNLIEGKSEEWVNVYLKNKFGQGDSGKPVYRQSFKKSFHVRKGLRPIMQSLNPLVVGMDNGLTAAAGAMQRDSRGRVNVLGECYVPPGVTMGVESFMDKMLIPMLTREFPGFRRENIIFAIDPACFQRSQIDEKTIAMAVNQRGFKTWKPPTNDPERRIQAVEGLLALQIDGGPAFAFDEEKCPHAINTMEWGYRWKKTPEGIVSTLVEKNHWSHMGDAIQYGAMFYNVHGTVQQGTQFTGRGQLRQIIPAPYVYA
jgi:hypothetical protein